jgi:hypothetical protein
MKQIKPSDLEKDVIYYHCSGGGELYLDKDRTELIGYLGNQIPAEFSSADFNITSSYCKEHFDICMADLERQMEQLREDQQ